MGCATNPRQPWILIVDDDENVLAIANDLIQRLGYNALIASNGVDALEILHRNQDVSVLFSDIGMPGMRGRAQSAAETKARQIADAARKAGAYLSIFTGLSMLIGAFIAAAAAALGGRHRDEDWRAHTGPLAYR